LNVKAKWKGCNIKSVNLNNINLKLCSQRSTKNATYDNAIINVLLTLTTKEIKPHSIKTFNKQLTTIKTLFYIIL
jgi:hypothetical protein